MTQNGSIATRRWPVVVLSVAGAILLIAGAMLWANAARAHSTDDAMREVRESLDIPAGWALTSENERTSGLLGLCFLSAMDARACPSTSLRFDLEEVPQSAAELQAILPDAQWEVIDEDCTDVPANMSGPSTTCRVTTAVEGFTVEVFTSVQVSHGGAIDDPWVFVQLEP